MKSVILFLGTTVAVVEARQRSRIEEYHTVPDIRDTLWAVLIHVKFVNTRELWCPGSIIAKSFVLTAAQCVCSRQIKSITITAGAINTDERHHYSVDAYHIHPKYPKGVCGKINHEQQQHDIAVLRTSKGIVFSNKIQSIDIDFSKIKNSLRSIKVGYSYEGGKPSHLIYNSTIARNCLRHFICTPKETNHLETGYFRGGPLVSCRLGLFKKCRQIGVTITPISKADFYVSTYIEQAFINRSLSNADGFVRVGAARDSAMSKLFISGLPFFILLISY